jgi:hypothetical protein
MYLYGDFCSGTVWMLDTRHSSSPQRLLESGKNISAFARDRKGELYLLDHGGGKIYRLSPRF